LLHRLRIENFVLIREAEVAFGSGLNAVTGETGAGKTILAQAIGLLLGARGDAGYVGPGAEEAYVEAELDLPDEILAEEGFDALAELRPEDERGLVAARRVFADGRTRAYAWGRSVPREELAALVERLIGMSGQFEQRRLARPSFQLEVLDAYVGEEQLRRRAELARVWRELVAARRLHDELAADAASRAARLDELEALVVATDGLATGTEASLRSERERLRRAGELAEAAQAAAEALVPEQADAPGAFERVAEATRSLEGVATVAPELAELVSDLNDAEIRIREAGSTLRAFLASLEAEPGRLEQVEGELERIADARRRFHAASTDELLERATAARRELEGFGADRDPLVAASEALARTGARTEELGRELATERTAAASGFADAVAVALSGLGMGEGEFRAELREREPGPAGSNEVVFQIRPNPGLPFAPVAETASGGELSRVALALRTVAHAGAGEPTIVFDEIDAGIGGRTAHAVADALRDLGTRAQIVTITHLPQIASVADVHFQVEKVPGDPTHTRIERLGEHERREELERMLGGAEFLSTLQ
jgi:DNA repair protein RecN (Recombination protein N)